MSAKVAAQRYTLHLGRLESHSNPARRERSDARRLAVDDDNIGVKRLSISNQREKHTDFV